MSVLTVRLDKEECHIPFVHGHSLLEILGATNHRIHSGCNGRGACGLCRVQIVAGKVNEPTLSESVQLDSTQLAQGIRLACQVMPKRDLQIVILNPAPKSNWRSLRDEERMRANRNPLPHLKGLARKVKEPYGIAVDLGTTHISLSLHDLSSGKQLTGRYGLNPQMDFGSDVMTRLVAASKSSEQAQAMSQQVIEAIGEALLDIAVMEGIVLKKVVHLSIVGNTTMLALLSGRNYNLLLQPNHQMRAIDCLPMNTQAWSESWGIHPQATIEVVPPLAGFVGSDLLAGVVASHIVEKGKGSLFIDFGANSEIALWDRQTLRVISAAGGPAFEGCGISCGMTADPGAIYRLSHKKGSPDFDFDVIASDKPIGLCSTGLVDLIAYLVRSGIITTKGRFTPDITREEFVLAQGKEKIVVSKGDIDVFQQAKAAVGVGIKVLVEEAGMSYNDLERVCVGGSFGYFLNVENAQAIGLLPKIGPHHVELCGNTALAGCEDILLSSVASEHLMSVRDKARIINPAQRSDFEDLFLKSLYLEPLKGD